MEMSVRAATAPLYGTVPGGNTPPSAAPAAKWRRRAFHFLLGLYKIKLPEFNSVSFKTTKRHQLQDKDVFLFLFFLNNYIASF